MKQDFVGQVELKELENLTLIFINTLTIEQQEAFIPMFRQLIKYIAACDSFGIQAFNHNVQNELDFIQSLENIKEKLK